MPRPSHLTTPLLLAVLLPGGDDPLVDGIEAYAEGRFADALAAFRRAADAAGDDAPAALWHNIALAALQCDATRDAEIAAEIAAARSGPAQYRERDFVLGNAAFARSRRAARQAEGPEAGPAVLALALLEAERAAAHWRRAATRGADWPAARRNAERALRLAAALRERMRAQTGGSQRDASERPPEPRADTTGTAPPPPAATMDDLVQRLLDKLNQRDAEKRALRRRREAATRVVVDKDW